MSYTTPPTWVNETVLKVSELQILSDDIAYLRNSAVAYAAPSLESPDGATTIFHIGNPAVACTSVVVFRNGVRQFPSADYTFTPGNNYVTFVSAPATGDTVSFDYIPS